MNYILLHKQKPIFLITKLLNQNPNVKVQTSDKIHPLENFKNSTVVADDMLLLKQESNIDLLFTRRHHNIINTYYKSQKYFDLPKNTLRNKSNIIILFKQTLGLSYYYFMI